MTLSNILVVGLGGFLGSVLRYVTSVTIDQRLNSIFPFGTFTVNIIGAFALGVISGWLTQTDDGAPTIRLLVITGFCGGFTTFSAFAFENFNLLSGRAVGLSILYVVVSVLLGVLAVWAGIATGRRFL